MSAKLSLSSLDNTSSRFHRGVRLTAIGIGVFAVLWGAADVTARIAHAALGQGANTDVFAPAAAAGDPGLLKGVNAMATSTATSTPFVPARLKIPSIGVDANVEQVGKKADGSMATPGNFTDVGWYALGSHPGQDGNAVFDGHVNNALTLPGVFGHLSQIHLGDYVTVSDTNGRTLVYKVTSINQFPADQAPAASIFATQGPSQLILITCDGSWVSSERTFDKRLVVTASPAYQ